MTEGGEPWAGPAPDATGVPFGRDPSALRPRRWWSRPSSLIAAGHTTAGLAWTASLSLLLAFWLFTELSNSTEGEDTIALLVGFFLFGIPAFLLALGLGLVAFVLLLTVVGPLALAWMREGKPERTAALLSLAHAVVAVAVPVVVLGVAIDRS